MTTSSDSMFEPIGDEATPLTMDHLASLTDGRLSSDSSVTRCETCGSALEVRVTTSRGPSGLPCTRMGCPDCAVPASPALPEPPVPWRSSHYPETCGECHHDASHDTKGGEGPPLCEEWDCDCRNFTPVPVEGDDSDPVSAARAAFDDKMWGLGPTDEVEAEAIGEFESAIRADERRVAEERVSADFASSLDALMAIAMDWRRQQRAAEERIAELTAQKDGAYSERNKTVIGLAWMALRAGCRVGVREHEGEWDDDWRAILMIDLPTGQASWHLHDSERPLLALFPTYPDEWDGHTTEEKYERLRALSKPAQEATSDQ